MSDFVKALREDPQWRSIGPYLYHTGEHLLLVQDEKCHLLRFLQDLYGIPKESGDSLEDDQADGTDESAIGSRYRYTDAEMEDLHYADPVHYSSEGFQIPPRKDSTHHLIEGQLVESALADDDTVRACSSRSAAPTTGGIRSPTEDDKAIQDMGSDFA